LFLPLDRGRHVPVHFEPNQQLAAVAAGEAGAVSFAMLPRSLDKIGRDASMKSAVASACHDVNGWTFHRAPELDCFVAVLLAMTEFRPSSSLRA
jgi:hypothetical protein